jgi:hypothetical protein
MLNYALKFGPIKTLDSESRQEGKCDSIEMICSGSGCQDYACVWTPQVPQTASLSFNGTEYTFDRVGSQYLDQFGGIECWGGFYTFTSIDGNQPSKLSSWNQFSGEGWGSQTKLFATPFLGLCGFGTSNTGVGIKNVIVSNGAFVSLQLVWPPSSTGAIQSCNVQASGL